MVKQTAGRDQLGNFADEIQNHNNEGGTTHGGAFVKVEDRF